MPKSTLAICAALAALTWMLPVAAQQNLPVATAQTQNIKRIPLQRFEVPGTAYETVIGIAEIGPNVSIGRHTHPGPESGYVIEGGFELLVEGEPPRMLKAGESYKISPHTIHDAKTGADGAKVIATYVVEKGQPLAAAVK
nr:cupin domain-containing protein [Bradyrhizobium sp. WSM2254]